MTTDVRTLLHDTAAVPERGPDIERAMRTARARRRRRGIGALVAVVVLALVVGVVALGSGGGEGASVAVAPRQTGAGSAVVPTGWKTIAADPGITIAVPPEWNAESTSETNIGTPVLNLVSLDTDVNMFLGACATGHPLASTPSKAGSILTLWEFPAASQQVPDVTNTLTDVVDRPTSFAGELIPGTNECTGVRYDQLAFRDSGRVFLVRVVSVFPAPAEEAARLALAAQVLDTLRISPVEEATTTEPVTGSLPATTGAPPFVATTDDEREITALIGRWLYFQSDDEIRDTIVGADSILDLVHEGMQEYRVNAPDGYSGDVHSLALSDATHATFEFTLLLHGSPLSTNQRGAAVKVDGRWMITRESECSLLALGQLICPPE
jgi:hypothetical protein